MTVFGVQFYNVNKNQIIIFFRMQYKQSIYSKNTKRLNDIRSEWNKLRSIIPKLKYSTILTETAIVKSGRNE
jgi:hypothetical protein